MRGANAVQAAYTGNSARPRKTLVVAIVAAAGLTAGALMTGLVRGDASAAGETPARVGYISFDTWYNTQDPRLVFGEASFVVVGRVTEKLRIDGDRTVFDVQIERELKGATPSTVRVSQLGHVDENEAVEVEGMPLMQPGNSYVIALTPPSSAEAQDALIVLTAAHGGNAVEVDGPNDPAVGKYRGFVHQQQSPYAVGASGYSDLKRLAEKWADGRPGYSTPGPVRPGS